MKSVRQRPGGLSGLGGINPKPVISIAVGLLIISMNLVLIGAEEPYFIPLPEDNWHLVIQKEEYLEGHEDIMDLEIVMDAVGDILCLWLKGDTASSVGIALFQGEDLDPVSSGDVELLSGKDVEDISVAARADTNEYYIIWKENNPENGGSGGSILKLGRSQDRGLSFESLGEIDTGLADVGFLDLYVADGGEIYCTYRGQVNATSEYECFMAVSRNGGGKFLEPLMVSDNSEPDCKGMNIQIDSRFIFCTWNENNSIRFRKIDSSTLVKGEIIRIDHLDEEMWKKPYPITVGVPEITANDIGQIYITWEDNREKNYWDMLFLSRSNNTGNHFFREIPPALNNTQTQQLTGGIFIDEDETGGMVYSNDKDVYVKWSDGKGVFSYTRKLTENGHSDMSGKIVMKEGSMFVLYPARDSKGNDVITLSKLELIESTTDKDPKNEAGQESWFSANRNTVIISVIIIIIILTIIIISVRRERVDKKGNNINVKPGGKGGNKKSKGGNSKSRKGKDENKRKRDWEGSEIMEIELKKMQEEANLALELLKVEFKEGNIEGAEYRRLKEEYLNKLDTLK